MTAEPDTFWFGRPCAQCFGTLWRPDASPTRAVVICNAVGYEGLIAGRPLRELARRLVQAGYLVVRFDYQGTGDSDGGDWEPARLKQWGESIDEAVGVAWAQDGVGQVYLAGFRLGATLACLYASEHQGVAGLALWAPCPEGTTYVRELRALSRLSAAARPSLQPQADYFPADSMEIVGFECGRTTIDDLRQINLVESLRVAPAPAAIIVDHTDRPPADSLAARLSELGTAVAHVRVDGYGEFMVDDETKSTFPEAAVQHLAEWFSTPLTSQEQASDPMREPPEVPTMAPALVVSEAKPIHFVPFGEHGATVSESVRWLPAGLFSIVSQPVDSALRRGVAVIILNTGLTNRVGQGRLSTELARYLASDGFSAVRLDLGGIGESPLDGRIGREVAYAPDRTKEVVAAVQWAHTNLADKVVLYGICSGAYHSFHAALAGAAVDTAVMVNPGIWYDDSYREAGLDIQVARNARRALLSRDNWGRLIHQPRETRESIKQATAGLRYILKVKVRAALGRYGVGVPEPVALSADLEKVVGRGVNLLVVFAAAEMGEHYLRTFASSVLPALESSGKFRIVDVDGGDHVFSAPGARQRLFEVIRHHLDDRYPATATGQPPLPEARQADEHSPLS